MKKKQKLKIMMIYLSIIASLTSGCSKKEIKNNKLNFNKIDTTTSYYDNSISNNNNYDNSFNNIDDYNYNGEHILLSEDSFNAFQCFLKENKTKYYYENYYEIDKAFSEYSKVKDLNVENHSYTIKELSAEELYNTVKKNNKIYLEREKYSASLYSELDDKTLKEVCDIIINTILYYQSDINDINETKCILGNLKIFSKPFLSNASVSDDNCLLMNINMINTLEIKKTSKEQNVFEDTISHETIHLLQDCCIDNKKIKYRIGNSYKFNNLEINSLFYNWFYEGSAEKLSNNYTGDTPLVYNYYINYINSLNLSTMLGNTNVDAAQKTTLDQDLDSLFKMFNCTTNEEEKEILNMMYSLNIIETDDEGFLNAIQLSNNSDEYIAIKRNIKASVCMTLTKHFYKNLAFIIKEKNLTLQDIFYLITIFESDINSHLTYADENKYQDNQEFIEEYLNIQNYFFNLITESNNYQINELIEIFDNYGLLNSNGINNYNLSFLPKEKQNLINEILEITKTYDFKQIRDCTITQNKGKVKTK